eukprot:123117-Heterocapsa_arctica.AAC.1
MLQALGPCQRHVLGHRLGDADGALCDEVHIARRIWRNQPVLRPIALDDVLLLDEELSLRRPPLIAGGVH